VPGISPTRLGRITAGVGLLALGLALLAGGPTTSGQAAPATSPVETPSAPQAGAKPERGAAPEKPLPPPSPAGKPLRTALVPVSGVIDTVLRTSVARRASEAVADGYPLILFHITSNGGYLDDGLELSRDVERVGRKAHTVAYVDSQAYSAAAIAAFACREIVMSPEASIGACTPYMASPTGVAPMEEEVRAKMEGVVIERLESLAAKNGYPPALLKAMVNMRTVVIEARNERSGEVRYVEEDDLFALGPDWQKGKTIVSGDEVLTVGADKALAYGIARHEAEYLDDLYDLYPIEGRMTVYPITWNETLVLWLNNMYFKALLVLVGLLGIYIELHTPGVGLPGAVGLVAFGLVFTASFLAGRPEWLPLLLFVVGAALLAVELFVTPGFGVMGTCGAVLILVGIILALPVSYRAPGAEGSVDWDALAHSLGMTTGVLVLFTVFAVVLARFLPQMPILKRLVLTGTVGSSGASRAAAAAQEQSARAGETGRTVTMLRPAGKARLGPRLVDVVTDGEFLGPETPIRVIQVRGNRIVVRRDTGPGAGPKAGAPETEST